jgi:hypothetical protein
MSAEQALYAVRRGIVNLLMIHIQFYTPVSAASVIWRRTLWELGRTGMKRPSALFQGNTAHAPRRNRNLGRYPGKDSNWIHGKYRKNVVLRWCGNSVTVFNLVGLLWTCSWTFGFHKMLGSSWVAAQLVAPQEGLNSVTKSVFNLVTTSVV